MYFRGTSESSSKAEFKTFVVWVLAFAIPLNIISFFFGEYTFKVVFMTLIFAAILYGLHQSFFKKD